MDNRERIQGYLREDTPVTNEKKSAMPTFGGQALDEQLDDVLTYLETLQGNKPAQSEGNR